MLLILFFFRCCLRQKAPKRICMSKIPGIKSPLKPRFSILEYRARIYNQIAISPSYIIYDTVVWYYRMQVLKKGLICDSDWSFKHTCSLSRSATADSSLHCRLLMKWSFPWTNGWSVIMLAFAAEFTYRTGFWHLNTCVITSIKNFMTSSSVTA